MSTLEVRIEEPVTFVISGASGDLTRRKLIPALYTLFKDGALTLDFAIVGFARRLRRPKLPQADGGFVARTQPDGNG